MSANTTGPAKNLLSNRQQEALPQLAAADSIAEGARRAQVNRATVYRWMQDDAFRAEFKRLRSEAAELADAEIQGIMLKAVAAIYDALDDNASPEKLRAAKIALDVAMKVRNGLDLERRLNRLDDALSTYKESKPW